MAEEDRDHIDWDSAYRRPTGATTVTTARYEGRCMECHEPIHVGEPIITDDDGTVHAECHDSAQPRRSSEPKENPVCTTCWLTHPVGACDR